MFQKLRFWKMLSLTRLLKAASIVVLLIVLFRWKKAMLSKTRVTWPLPGTLIVNRPAIQVPELDISSTPENDDQDILLEQAILKAAQLKSKTRDYDTTEFDALRLVAIVTSVTKEPADAVTMLLNEGLTVYGVGDEKGPKEPWKATPETGGKIHFLTATEQRKCIPATSAYCEFVQYMPWTNYARKNVAYLLAMKTDVNVNYFWDFDDDNLQVGNLLEGIKALLADTNNYRFGLRGVSDKYALNPYPTLGADDFVYPRGFPLEFVQNMETHGGELVRMVASVPRRTVVYQAAADGNPDVDAVFRLTRNFDIKFKSTVSSLILDNRFAAPYNAQATLHKRAAFWCLYLPNTYKRRVGDILRSYVAQTLFRLFDMNVAFTKPLVVHDRSPHNLISDLVYEWPLYTRIKGLLEHMDNWAKKQIAANDNKDARQLMIDLYSSLHKIGFVGKEDIIGVRLWLNALDEIGYEFPKRPKILAQDQQIESPVAHKFPIFHDLFQSVDITENHWEVIGPLRALYARMFPHYRMYVARMESVASGSRCRSPFVGQTSCWVDRRGIQGHYGLVDYYSYLDAVQLLSGDSVTQKAPGYLLWHHDDLLINVTSLRGKFDDKAWTAVIEREPGRYTEESVKIEEEAKLVDGWQFEERETISVLERLFEENPAFFQKDGAICAELLNGVKGAWSSIRGKSEYGKPEGLAAFYIQQLIRRRQQSDFLLTKWKEMPTFHDRLQVMFDHNVHLEIAVRVALRCSHSIDVMNRSIRKLNVSTNWDTATRGTISKSEQMIAAGNVNLLHPVKTSFSQEHLSLALRFRDSTV